MKSVFLHPVILLRNITITLVCCLGLSACGLFQTSTTHNPTPVGGQKVVNTAYSQMGKHYRPGGASPQKGFDCSGLVWWAYTVNGYKIPRITSDQARTGVPVPKNLMRTGDIVVFRTGEGPQSLHTGLYAGGNSFIHSPRSGGKVRMESMDIPYWRKNLVAVRRVVR
ncbi:MAG: C40 family peptidase [Desulfovibrio sp.]|nr:C40 family peptidase [Desulfovibrio sp.]